MRPTGVRTTGCGSGRRAVCAQLCRAGRVVGHGGPTLRAGGPAAGAFTIIELIVVITVIVLILAVAVPGMAKLNADARLSSAYQTINATLTRAYYLAQSDRTMTAVRFVPGAWELSPDPNNPLPAKRQHMVIYKYVGNPISEDPGTPGRFILSFTEYFQRAEDLNPSPLPEDVWVAPIEALNAPPARASYLRTNASMVTPANFGADFVLNGDLGQFEYNADENPSNNRLFLNADDFLVVIDPQTGVQTGMSAPYRMRAYAPGPPAGNAGYEVEGDPANMNARPYQRFGFSGVVAYSREQFTGLGVNASGTDRQDLLREIGRPYLAHRFSGGLKSGAQRPAQ